MVNDRNNGLVLHAKHERVEGLANKRHIVKPAKFVALSTVVVAMSVALVVGVSLSFATAGDSPESAELFGIGSSVSSTSTPVYTVSDAPSTTAEGSVLSSVASRDISDGIKAVDAKLEAERKAAEEQARKEEQARIEAARQAKAEQAERNAVDAAAGDLASLPDVDWECGKDAFIAEWTKRIDAYLAGSVLEGYGKVFATAAWDNNVDPRWSPAISNTESGKGSNCFRDHNAWGWGQTGWSSWEEAINAHVAGLAAGYGYSITLGAAAKYCPPTYTQWFQDTLGQMKQI